MERNASLLSRVQELAEKISQAELFSFWLELQARESDEKFVLWLRDLASWSKQDLIDIIHEMTPESGREFLARFEPAVEAKGRTK